MPPPHAFSYLFDQLKLCPVNVKINLLGDRILLMSLLFLAIFDINSVYFNLQDVLRSVTNNIFNINSVSFNFQDVLRSVTNNILDINSVYFNLQYVLRSVTNNILDINSVYFNLQDVLRSVTSFAVRESRAQDLRNEMLNSEK